VYGPVRTVVWEDGGANNPASYPIPHWGCPRQRARHLVRVPVRRERAIDSSVCVVTRVSVLMLHARHIAGLVARHIAGLVDPVPGPLPERQRANGRSQRFRETKVRRRPRRSSANGLDQRRNFRLRIEP
jgi:hypothetical protein